MSRREDKVALLHMRDHATEAVENVRGRDRSDLDNDRIFALAMIKLVEIIGEAAGRVSTPMRDTHKQIPWKQIIGTRHRLVHGYDQIDFDILWKIVSFELPRISEQLEEILNEDNTNES
ncbi:MAG: DUF86 domain-containing protein [Candidatus Latescibacter sp.]|nr:DUF86 domain-containing protein [Candidatus Latescibacter sp.]